MGSLSSYVERKGKRDEMGEVVPIPVLKTDRKTGASTSDDLAAFEGAYREDASAIEVALSRGILPNPEKPAEAKTAAAALEQFKAGKMNIVDLTMARFEPFQAADKVAFEAYIERLKKKYKALESEDMRKRPLSQLSYA